MNDRQFRTHFARAACALRRSADEVKLAPNSGSEIVLYQTEDGKTRLESLESRAD